MVNTFFFNRPLKEIEPSSLLLKKNICPQTFSQFLTNEGQNEASYIISVLKDILPEEAHQSEEALFGWIARHFPYVSARFYFPSRSMHTVYLFCHASQEFKQEDFFQEMLKRHLIPGRDLNLSLFRSIRFQFKEREEHLFLIAEAAFAIEEKKTLEQLHQYFPRFSQMVSMSCYSPQAARCVNSLQTHSFLATDSYDQKISRTQKDLLYLRSKFPDKFNNELFQEWGSFLALSSTLFLQMRPFRTISRLIAHQYYMRRLIKRSLLIAPDKRHLFLRFLPSHLQSPFGQKPVLGVLITLTLFDKYEQFDEEHILLAIKKWVQAARLVQGSRYLFRNPQEERICTIYIELDKEEGTFTFEERALMRKYLAFELKERVQKLMPILFTVRNEEQVMKNIIILSQELTKAKSLPQMMISFEKQTEIALVFTLIVVYLAEQKSIEEKIYGIDSFMEVSLERKDIVGYLDDGTPKEAAVFRLQIAKTSEMIRRDFSVNVHLARQKAYHAICQAIGEVRDYDGGLILKQHELFSQLQSQFAHLENEKGELLENFFYSITPIEKQATLSLKVLSNLFSLVLASLQENLSQKGSFFFKIDEDYARLYVFIRAESASLKKYLRSRWNSTDFSPKQFVSSQFYMQETFGVGFILETADLSKRTAFVEMLKEALTDWHKERREFQVLRLNVIDSLISLDPRLAGDEDSKTILMMLFEGLTRIGLNGKAECAVADSIELSSDLKTYTFHLKECYWSKGVPVRASDFAYAWKKILSPNFETPFAYVFYAIKNAKAAKEGKISLDDVGIHVIDNKCLKVVLEHPLPYFLELVAQPLFSPIHEETDRSNPHWSNGEGDDFICNGPFKLKKNKPLECYILEKNLLYHDHGKVYLNQVVMTKGNARTAVEMFKNDEIDWIGRPMRSWESIFELAKTDKTTEIQFNERLCWCSLNVKKFPLSNPKFRQALYCAIDRGELVDYLRDGNANFSVLPPKLTFHKENVLCKGENPQEMAKRLFNEVLEESKLTLDQFPSLFLIYPEVEKREKTAKIIRNQWKKVLGIDVTIQNYPWPLLFRKITEGNYEMALVMWSSWINDPMYTLNAFKSPDQPLNFPKWEHVEYNKLLDAAFSELNAKRRLSLLSEAETILLNESPVIPLFYEYDRGLKKKSLQIDEKFGALDFRRARFSE